jgi:hypothetical protein
MSHTHPSIVIAFLLLSGLAFAQDLPDAPSAAAGNFAPAKFESRPVYKPRRLRRGLLDDYLRAREHNRCQR